ncbi:MAG: type II toxin-antitoxin system PemK/MazF family toxin [Candidatus Nomurabacteria bacterium]|jgi:mRNA interferase MazF|nr:type II toxin-antitoxin system PemK/MazF family toxin [Candidatus Nomurabacteria bacterium]
MSNTIIYKKDFDGWNRLKKKLDKRESVPNFNEGEVWWANIGTNVSFEQDGKSENYSRPVLIIGKINQVMFFGVPLTSQSKRGYYYFELGEIEEEIVSVAMISQARSFSANRLYERIGTIGKKKLTRVRRLMAERPIKIVPTKRPSGVAANADLCPKYSKPNVKSQVKGVKK